MVRIEMSPEKAEMLREAFVSYYFPNCGWRSPAPIWRNSGNL